MTQPSFAPIAKEDEVRESYRLEPPAPWRATRPGDLRPGARSMLAGAGVPGPDQGYALGLARRFRDRLVLQAGEHADDVLAGAFAIGLRRASLYGRAPVSTDIELPLVLFGFLGDAPEELVEVRRALFAGVTHSYDLQRALAGKLPDSTLRLTPDGLRRDPTGWSELIST